MRFLTYLAILVTSLFVVACGGGGGSSGTNPNGTPVTPLALATTTPTALTMSAGASRDFTISGGTSPYTATSSDSSVVVTSVSGSTVTIGAVGAGTAQVVIRDALNQTVNSGVTVTVKALFTSAPSSVTIAIGAPSAQTYVIGGGTAPYKATSANTNVAAAQVSGNLLTVTGVSVGSTSIIVTDNAGNAVTIGVTIPAGATVAFFTTAPSAITAAAGTTPGFSLGGGTGPYTATTTNPAVATASVSGNTLTITAVASGSANIQLRDSTGATLNVAVTVPSAATVFSTAPSAVTIAIGASPVYTIGGGSTPYTATSSNTSVATVSVSGTSLTINGLSAGTANIVLRDNAGSQVTIAVTVPAANSLALFTTAPTPVNIAAAATADYAIGGGTQGYTVTSSNVSVATATLIGTSTLRVTGVSAGNANIQVRDAGGTALTIAVVVPVTTGPALATTAPAAITMAVGTNRAFTVSGGTGPYTAESTNNAVVTASQVGSTLTITAVSTGSGSVVVRDAAGATQTIAVSVSSSQIALNPTTVSAFIGDTVYSTISGGTGPFTIIEGFPDATDTDTGFLSTSGVFTPSTSGNVLRMVVKQTVASDVIVVRDTGGSQASFTLTASAGTNQISLSPSSLSISELGPYSIDLKLYGAVGTVNLFSSNTSLVTVTTPVAGSSAGTTVTITKTGICVAADTPVTITAIDSLGSKATSTVTVTDNSTALCDAPSPGP